MVHEENEENATFFWKGRFISLTERIISLEIKKKKQKNNNSKTATQKFP